MFFMILFQTHFLKASKYIDVSSQIIESKNQDVLGSDLAALNIASLILATFATSLFIPGLNIPGTKMTDTLPISIYSMKMCKEE